MDSRLGKKLKTENKTFDLICSSMLLRAMQTANLIKNEIQSKSEILVLPFVAETGFTRDNKPKWFYESELSFPYNKLNIDYNHDDFSNYELFLKIIFPLLQNLLIKSNPLQKKFRIMIVSHQHFIEKNIKPYLNSSLQINNCDYIIERNAEQHFSEIIKYGIKKGIQYINNKDFTYVNSNIQIKKDNDLCGCDKNDLIILNQNVLVENLDFNFKWIKKIKKKSIKKKSIKKIIKKKSSTK